MEGERTEKGRGRKEERKGGGETRMKRRKEHVHPLVPPPSPPNLFPTRHPQSKRNQEKNSSFVSRYWLGRETERGKEEQKGEEGVGTEKENQEMERHKKAGMKRRRKNGKLGN